VLSGRGLGDELITRPEEYFRLWCVVLCDLETSRMRRPWPTLGRSATAKKKRKKNPIINSKICPLFIYMFFHLSIHINSSACNMQWNQGLLGEKTKSVSTGIHIIWFHVKSQRNYGTNNLFISLTQLIMLYP